MAFSYTAGSTADADRVRLELGDTDEDRALFNDAEVTDLLEQESSYLEAAARGCEILSVRFARDFTFTADGARFEKGTMSQTYANRAKELRGRATSSGTVMPERHDGYSDDITSDEAVLGVLQDTFEAGRFNTSTGRI